MLLNALLPTRDIGTDPAKIRDWAQAAEDLGYHCIEVPDHVFGAAPRGDWTPLYSEHDPFHETFTMMAFLAGVTGAEVKTEHPLYKLTSDAIVATTGRPPYVNAMHTSSDIRVPMVQKGIPTVGLGPLGGDLSQNGKIDEWVDVEDYLRGVKVAASARSR